MFEKTREYLDSLSKEELISALISLGFNIVTNCEHEWKYVGISEYGGDLHIIYCPKCDNTKLVNTKELENIRKIQKIKKEWDK